MAFGRGCLESVEGLCNGIFWLDDNSDRSLGLGLGGVERCADSVPGLPRCFGSWVRSLLGFAELISDWGFVGFGSRASAFGLLGIYGRLKDH